MTLSKDCKIYVAGHRGLVGSAIWNNLKERGYENLIGRTHKELDLFDPIAVKKFFDGEKFTNTDFYLQRCDKFFPIHDNHNCERIYNAIVKIREK